MLWKLEKNKKEEKETHSYGIHCVKCELILYFFLGLLYGFNKMETKFLILFNYLFIFGKNMQ